LSEPRRGPEQAAAVREQTAVRVEHRLVGLVRNGGQDLVLAVGGVGEHLQCLVGVRGQHDLHAELP